MCFKTDKDECVRRAIVCQQPDLVPIIERMAENLEWPTEEAWSTTAGSGRVLHYVADGGA